MLAPCVKALAEKYQGKLSVGMIDADEFPDLVMEYSVMGLPTLILFRGGQAVQRIVGFQPRERIEAQIVSFLSTEKA
jgi:thioredoxin